MALVTFLSALVGTSVPCFMKFLLISFGMYAAGGFINFSLCVSVLVFLWKLGEKGAVAKNGGLSVNVSLSAEHTKPPHVLQSFTASSLQPGDYAHQQACTPFPVHGHVPDFHDMILSVVSLRFFLSKAWHHSLL